MSPLLLDGYTRIELDEASCAQPKVASGKSLVRTTQKYLDPLVFQWNSGRVHSNEKYNFLIFFGKSYPRKGSRCRSVKVASQKRRHVSRLNADSPPQSHPWSVTRVEKLLESFDGFVDQIVDDVAFVKLTSSAGEELFGEYSAKELAAKGIFERTPFKCRTVDLGNGQVRVDIVSKPLLELTPEEEEKMRQELGGDQPYELRDVY